MFKRFKKAAAAVMVLVLMLGLLAACDNTGSSDNGEEKPDFVYVASYKTLSADKEIQYIQSCCYSNGRIYFIASIADGTATGEQPPVTYASATDVKPVTESATETYEYTVYRTALFSAADDGSDVQELTNYVPTEIPEGSEGSSGINSMTADAEGNIWVLENVYTYSFNLPEGFDETTGNKWEYQTDSTQKFILRKLDSTGAELLSIDLSFMAGESEYFYINNFVVDGAGNPYVFDGDGNVSVLDGTGAQLFKLENPNGINGIVRLADGSVGVVSYDEAASGNILRRIDLTTKSFGESKTMPYNAWSFYAGNGDYDFFYNTESSLFGYNLDTGTSTKLINWINSDVDSNGIMAIMPVDENRVLCCSATYNPDGTSTQELITMTKTPYSEAQHKTVLTYACMYLDYNIRSQIIKFNKTNPDYRIEVKDYSEYNTQNDYTAGLTKLTTEIISGKVPDLMDTNSLPIRQYAAKGLLEDLWPYIDADSELGGRDALMTPVFKALELEGGLYQICPSFSITTVIGASSVVGDKPGWTLDELYAALDKMPEGTELFSMGVIKSDILYQCCALSMNDFVNWQTGKCTFDGQDFINLLKFTDMFPATFDWESIDWESGEYEDESTRIISGKQMLSIFYANDFQYYQMYKHLFGGKITFIGFPTESRNGSAFQADSGLAMSSQCEHKDGAWQFMRTMLTEDYQETNVWNFPTNKNVFNDKLETAMTPTYYTDPETGEQVEQSKGSWGWGDTTIDIYALTQEEADQFMALINTTTKVYNYDQNIMKIINEETAAFFAGQKSAEDTASMIQSRVNLYVNEQR